MINNKSGDFFMYFVGYWNMPFLKVSKLLFFSIFVEQVKNFFLKIPLCHLNIIPYFLPLGFWTHGDTSLSPSLFNRHINLTGCFFDHGFERASCVSPKAQFRRRSTFFFKKKKYLFLNSRSTTSAVYRLLITNLVEDITVVDGPFVVIEVLLFLCSTMTP